MMLSVVINVLVVMIMKPVVLGSDDDGSSGVYGDGASSGYYSICCSSCQHEHFSYNKYIFSLYGYVQLMLRDYSNILPTSQNVGWHITCNLTQNCVKY